MFYSPGDISKLEKFNKDKSVQERENAAILLLEMVSYAESSICRRKQLLHYFGESFDGNCDACDNCLHPKEEFDGEEFVWTALDAVRQTKERFGIDHLVDVIRGVESQYVKSYNHDDLDIFGKGDEHSAEFWKSVVRQTLLHELILKDIDNVGVLKLSDKGRDFLENPVSLKLTKDHEYSDLGEEEEPDQAPMASACDEELFEILKALRKKVAKEKGFPPYVIFQDPSLDEMATIYPTSKEELARINGVGMGKVNKFGDVFMEAIQKYVKENDITTANDVVVKSAINKSKLKIYIIQAIDRKIDLDEISETKNTTPEEVLKEIENIIYSGTKLNLDYYINQVLDPERQEDLMEYFLNAETDDLQVAMDDDANQDYSEEEIRLMRIKFLSEYAN
jgi:ATP-dependent DNA helicase RecQ